MLIDRKKQAESRKLLEVTNLQMWWLCEWVFDRKWTQCWSKAEHLFALPWGDYIRGNFPSR